MNEHSLNRVDTHTHLGVTLNSKITWHDHVKRVTEKAYRVINMIKRIRHLVPRSTLENLYKTLVRPILEYGNIIYTNLSQALNKKLEDCQRSATVLCTGALQITSYNLLLTELGWDSLLNRRKYYRLVLMYKIQNDLAPSYLRNILPPIRARRSNYNLRNASNFTIPVTRTKKFSESYIPLTIKDWNVLPQLLRDCTTLVSFKGKLKHYLQFKKPNKLHSVGSFDTQKCTTRLRLGLSPLREHLHRHHIVDDNICTFCNLEPETSSHFILRCPTFSLQRLKLFTNMLDLLPMNLIQVSDDDLIQTLLSGNNTLSFDINIKVIFCIQDFIQSSKRFTYIA